MAFYKNNKNGTRTRIASNQQFADNVMENYVTREELAQDLIDIDGIITEPVYELVSAELHEGYYINRNNGAVSALADASYYEIPVQEGEEYRIVSSQGYAIAVYALYDSSDNFISGYPIGSTTGVNFFAVDVVIPSGITIMRCSGYYSRNSTVGALYIYKKTSKKLKVVTNNDILYGKKWVACGDSFTAGYFDIYVDSDGHKGTMSDAFDKLNGVWKTYPYWVQEKTGIVADWKTCAAGGIDFTNITGATTPFSDNTTRWNYTKIPSDADYVTLAFGLNETDLTAEQIGQAGDTTNETLWGAYDVVIKSILTNNPYTKIGIIILDAWMSQSYHDALVEIANYYDIPYLDLKSDAQVPVGINGKFGTHSTDVEEIRTDAFTLTTSNAHPNLKAHKYRSTFIENFLRSL